MYSIITSKDFEFLVLFLFWTEWPFTSHPLVGYTSFLSWRSQQSSKRAKAEAKRPIEGWALGLTQYLCCIYYSKQVGRPTWISRGREVRLQSWVWEGGHQCLSGKQDSRGCLFLIVCYYWWPGFKFQLYHSLSSWWAWACHWACLSLSFLLYRDGMVMVSSS